MYFSNHFIFAKECAQILMIFQLMCISCMQLPSYHASAKLDWGRRGKLIMLGGGVLNLGASQFHNLLCIVLAWQNLTK